MTHDVPPGWYPDPLRTADERFWDGDTWTQQTRSEEGDQTGTTGAAVVVPPPPPVVRSTKSATSPLVLGLVGIAVAAVAAVVAVLLIGGSNSDTGEALPQTTLNFDATVPTEATETVPTTNDPTSSTATTVVPTADAAGTEPSSTTSHPVESTAEAQALVIAPTMVSASCQGTNGVEGDLVTPVLYTPSNVVDDVPATAWRCDRAEVMNGALVIDLGRPVRIMRVGMVAGYYKVDAHNGVDRFIQNHRVARARWEFDDGQSVVVDYADDRRVQFAELDATTTVIRIVVEDYWPSSGTLARDMIAISEVDIWGVP